jgi:hypothetical protein
VVRCDITIIISGPFVSDLAASGVYRFTGMFGLIWAMGSRSNGVDRNITLYSGILS